MRLRVSSLIATVSVLLSISTVSAGVVNFGPHIGLVIIPSSPTPPSAREVAADAIERTVEAARTQLHRIHAVLVRQLSADADVIRARQDAARASTAYESLKEARLATFRATPQAQAQSAAILDLDQALDAAKDEARAQGRAANDRTTTLAAKLLAARSEMTHEEVGVLRNDETVQRYHYAQIDAAARLAEIETDLADRIRGDAQWQAAKANLERARGQMASLTD